jgi:S1-C subfamily serine protease
MHAASLGAVLAMVIAVPAFAGGAHCGSKSASVTTASNASCHDKAESAAWAGAWLQRSNSGAVTVAEVAKNSPAAKSGLKAGDVVLAVNGYDLSNAKDAAMCASKAECSVGSTVAYTVQRGRSTKSIKVKLEKMPEHAATRFANRQASFDPALAAMVIPATVQ